MRSRAEREIRALLGSCGPNGLYYPFQKEQVVTVRRGETTHVHFEARAPGEALRT